jgi:hypothetical protein
MLSVFPCLVLEDGLVLINSNDVWPNDCCIAPFYGKLKTVQVYSSSTDVKLIKGGAESAVASRSINSNTVSPAVTIEASAN